jgi:hypothetical protein
MIVLNVVPTEKTSTQVVQPTLQWETSYRSSIPGRLKIAAVVSEKIFRIFIWNLEIIAKTRLKITLVRVHVSICVCTYVQRGSKFCFVLVIQSEISVF